MKGITRAYLLYLLSDYLKFTIHLRRNTPRNYFDSVPVEITEDEITDFIVSIPYFGVELKDFLVGNLPVQMIIISREWEKDFTCKAVAWATDVRWTLSDMSFLPNKYQNVLSTDFLNMPY